MYRIINSTTGKYCSVAFIWIVTLNDFIYRLKNKNYLVNVINNTTGRHCSVTFINLNQWSPHVLIFLFRYLDDVALHHLVDALCRLSTTSMEQAQSNKVINFPSPQSSLLRAVCAFRVTCSERVFFRPIVSDTSPKYIDREGLGVFSGWAGDWVAVVSSCIMGLSWVGYRFFHWLLRSSAGNWIQICPVVQFDARHIPIIKRRFKMVCFLKWSPWFRLMHSFLLPLL